MKNTPKPLPSDVARCTQRKCKLRLLCLRWLGRSDERARAFIEPTIPKGACRFMLEEKP